MRKKTQFDNISLVMINERIRETNARTATCYIAHHGIVSL